MAGLEEAVDTQLRLAGAEAAEAGSMFMAAMRPAIREAMISAIAMAVEEISGQLPASKVEVMLVDGDPELVVSDDPGREYPTPQPATEGDDDARITLRLPGYLKELIAEAADTDGASVNGYVVESLLKSTRRFNKTGSTRHRTRIEL